MSQPLKSWPRSPRRPLGLADGPGERTGGGGDEVRSFGQRHRQTEAAVRDDRWNGVDRDRGGGVVHRAGDGRGADIHITQVRRCRDRHLWHAHKRDSARRAAGIPRHIGSLRHKGIGAFRQGQRALKRRPGHSGSTFLGDGEFDGTALQDTLSEMGWSYVCRTAMSTTATWEGETFRLDVLGACIQPGRLIELKEVYVTRDVYGPIMVLCCWAKGYREPLYMVSNLATAEEACRLYQKRFRIETFFSDQKSRGFHIHTSHISDPQRLSRL